MTSTERKIRDLSQALEFEGVRGVQVDVDDEDTVYLTGEVGNSDAEVRAVELAIECGASRVEDGITFPGQALGHLNERAHVVTPYVDDDRATDDPGLKILRGGDLSHRIFDGRSHDETLRTGNAIAPES